MSTWEEYAACRDTADLDVFFQQGRETESERVQREQAAKTICAGCLVRTDCAMYAMTHRIPEGIWGGMTEAERRTAIRRDKVPSHKGPSVLPNCGTEAGWATHRRRGEQACPECVEGKREARRLRYSAENARRAARREATA